MSDSFRPSAAGGQEGPRPIISAELLLHLSSATSLDQTANTVTAVSQESQDCCHYSLPSDPQVPSPIPGAGAGQSGEGVLPSKSSVPPAPIGGLLPSTLESQIAFSATFAEIDKRRLPMALVSKTNSFSTNNASQSLPHWLREFSNLNKPHFQNLPHYHLQSLQLQRQQHFCTRIVRLASLPLFIPGPRLHLQKTSQRGTLKVVGLQGSWIP